MDAPTLFLSLPVEVRNMIYHECFSDRGIILTHRLTQVDRWGRDQKSERFDDCLDEPRCSDGSTIPLLQICKQVYAEAQPIHAKSVPSHLIFDQTYGVLPNVPQVNALQSPLGVPMAYITRLTFHATNLGSNKKRPKKCPRIEMEEMDAFHISNCRVQEYPKPLPERLPNFKGLAALGSIVSGSLPALREVHIKDILEYGIKGISDPCYCPKAGTSSCTCDRCTCTCTVVLPLVGPDTDSPTEAMEQFHEELLSRYRDALPMPKYSEDNQGVLDWSAMLCVLQGGAHFYLHDSIGSTSSNDANDGHERVWRATYHLAPLVICGEGPKNPPTEIIQSPRRRRLDGTADTSAVDEQGPHNLDEFTIDFSTLENADVLENFDFDSFLANSPPSPPSEFGVEGTPFEGESLLRYETSLQIKLVEEAK